MTDSTEFYEPPVLVELGDFAELTRITDKGGYIDLFGGWWLN